MRTSDVVEAALIPELLYSVAIQSLLDKDAKNVTDALERDVNAYREVLPLQTKQRETFDRYLDKTATAITKTFYDKQANGYDAITMFSTFIELTSILAKSYQLKVTADLAFAVRVISEKMAEQHEETWAGMMKVADKRANRVLKMMQERGYYLNKVTPS